jgi:hypothetical protein
MDDYQLKSDEKRVLQSQTDRSSDNPTKQTSLSRPPPLLQFRIQKDGITKDSVELKITEKDVLNSHKENINGIFKQKGILRYNTLDADNLIDYYIQTGQPLIQLYLDNLKLQKDFIDAFQPQWVDHMRTMVENYLGFQDKMIFLYIQNYNTYLNSVFDIKNNNSKKDG